MSNAIDDSRRFPLLISLQTGAKFLARLLLRVAGHLNDAVGLCNVVSKTMSLRRTKSVHSNRGEVFLIGAGPGDPDLLTLRAAQVLSEADVIVYNRLISKEIMRLCPTDAESICHWISKEPETLNG